VPICLRRRLWSYFNAKSLVNFIGILSGESSRDITMATLLILLPVKELEEYLLFFSQ
jgi:hypothetical protein